MEYILNFSGGKDSTALLLKLLEEGRQVDEILYCNTGMEFPEMYDHIEKVEKYIGREITKLTPPRSFEELLYKYGIPTPKVRWCTKSLKIRVIEKYLCGREYTQYMGFAVGEENRKAKFDSSKYLFPLIDDFHMTEKDCLQYCYERGFDWNGLYKKMDRLSCWCCPLQKISDFKVIYEDYPDYWNQLKKWESDLGKSWLLKESTDSLEVRYEYEKEIGAPVGRFKCLQDELKRRRNGK